MKNSEKYLWYYDNVNNQLVLNSRSAVENVKEGHYRDKSLFKFLSSPKQKNLSKSLQLIRYQKMNKPNRREFLHQNGLYAMGISSLNFFAKVSKKKLPPNESTIENLREKKDLPLSCVLDFNTSMFLAGKNLLGVLSPDHNYLPLWVLSVKPNYEAEFHFWWPAHNLGRWLDAMLRLESATGFRIPPKLESACVNNLRRFFDNPDHICINPDPEDFFELHSLREGMLALHALVRYRDDSWARAKAKKMMETLNRAWLDEGKWNLDAFVNSKRKNHLGRHFDPTGSCGRMIEALIYFYEATGEPLAIDLAQRFAKYNLENSTNPDGTINYTSKPDHTHSYMNTLKGLLLFGKLTSKNEYIDRVSAVYYTSIRKLISEAGFNAHDLGTDGFGEVASAGDSAQLALWLALMGDGKLLDDAERLLRVRLLASQIIDTPPLKPVKDDNAYIHRDLTNRIIGAYGGCHEHPHGGKQAVTDVTSAVLHSVIDLYNHAVQYENDKLIINFHVSCETEHATIESKRDTSATLKIIPKKLCPVMIRIPNWIPKESISIKVSKQTIRAPIAGCFAFISPKRPSGTIEINYALPERITKDTLRGIEFTYKWRGDDIVGIHPNTDFYPFYPNL
ncbi:MAG: hypothetical protein N3G21_00005 [Candidatus Hydrogenedentes bacterium]|nr:hypothetical protein [Candidatus Hydrogenedentota bacterium]